MLERNGWILFLEICLNLKCFSCNVQAAHGVSEWASDSERMATFIFAWPIRTFAYEK